MSKFFVQSNQINGDTIVITGTDAKHITKVLRQNVGDKLCVCDNCSTDYYCTITHVKTDVICQINQITPNHNELAYDITVYQAIPKSDKLEYIVQKLTEIGVHKIVPLQTKRVENRLNENKLARLNRIAEESAKQSNRGRIIKIDPPTPFETATLIAAQTDLFIIPYENEKNTTIKQAMRDINKAREISIFIGSEGGYEESEILTAKQQGAKVVTLGNTILRTETAGLVAVSMINYEFMK